MDLPYDLDALIRDLRLDGIVETFGQVSFTDSLARLAGSDAALLLQPGTQTQIPSKLFEYIGLGITIVSVAPAGSSVEIFVKEKGLGIVADFRSQCSRY